MYKDAFNQGYYLAKNDMELYKTISKAQIADGHYYQGFINGGKEYEIELNKERLNQLKNIQQNKDKENSREL